MEQSETISQWIKSREYLRRTNGLSRLKALMKILGNPQKTFKSIHISGTNGKGSTISFMKNLFMAHDLSVGTFVSPHLNSYYDRVAINGIPINQSDFERIGKKIKSAEQKIAGDYETLTFFEIMTAMMFIYFKEQQVDVALIEVGIGGLYDVTNIIQSEISVITSIGLDHQNILGNTIEEIATQKAGIFKEQTISVIGPLPLEAQAICQQTAQKQQSDLYQYGKDYKLVKVAEGKLVFATQTLTIPIEKIGLVGNHQLENAAVAIEVFHLFMQQQALALDKIKVARAIAMTSWPGRMEQVFLNPAIWLDGCHNLPAVYRLAETIKQQTASDQRIIILFAALAKKDYQEMLLVMKQLLPQATIVITTFNDEHAAGKEEFATIMQQIDAVFCDNYQVYLDNFINKANQNDILYITGSLYLIAEVRKYIH